MAVALRRLHHAEAAQIAPLEKFGGDGDAAAHGRIVLDNHDGKADVAVLLRKRLQRQPQMVRPPETRNTNHHLDRAVEIL